jgi:chromosome segregation ATPase
MNWLFLGIIAGAIGYLAMVLLGFFEKHRENRDKIEQTQIDIKRLENQFSESEKARIDAEERTATLEKEGLEYEQEISELHHNINRMMPSDEKGDDETQNTRPSNS